MEFFPSCAVAGNCFRQVWLFPFVNDLPGEFCGRVGQAFNELYIVLIRLDLHIRVSL